MAAANQSITNNTADACPSGLAAVVPDEWRSSNFTDMACAVPACSNFTESLSGCCGSELDFFDTEFGRFATCTPNSMSSDRVYTRYQRCLQLGGVFPFQCNNINSATQETCPDEIPRADLRAGERHQVCALRATPDAIEALQGCCTNGSTNPDVLVPYDHGCHVYCKSDPDGGVLRTCLQGQLGADTDMSCFGMIEIPEEDNAVEAFKWSYGGILAALLVVAAFVT